jgi:hypothetical protein
MGFRRYGTAPDQQVTEAPTPTEPQAESPGAPEQPETITAVAGRTWTQQDVAELAQESER